MTVGQLLAQDGVVVGDPGNACETQPTQGCFGGVAETYRISEFEVTNAQYTEFLNAVAAFDPNQLYNTLMDSDSKGGITRSGSSGTFTYSAKAGRQDMPVNFVSFYDALRFANWLHNGQTTGTQDDTTTEDGAYTITAQGIVDNSITRNTGATNFLTSEAEWYKAAYYDVPTTSYFAFPAGEDTGTACTAPGATPNTANCNFAVGDLSDVGSYTGSASPNGTFDQGGNLWEWNEVILGTSRGLRGGAFVNLIGLAASSRGAIGPADENVDVGFRVASLASAAPAVPSLSPFGIALLSSLLGLAGWRKLRRSRDAIKR